MISAFKSKPANQGGGGFMAEIEIGLQTMYETQIREREQHTHKKRSSLWLLGAILAVLLVGSLLPSPTNLYVWGVGSASAYAFYTL